MQLESNLPKKERAVLAAVYEDSPPDMDELCALAEAAGAEVVDVLTQKCDSAGAFLFGKGKLEELKKCVAAHSADIVICDNELKGSQLRNLSDNLDVKVIDRYALILDIFAARAKSSEGKLQVELAQLKYSLPRLIGSGGKMSKYGGGIGMRGPGEKKLETDRRSLRGRISDLEKRLGELEKQRDLRRGNRKNGGVKTVALVGYTNAGKSTVMNVLSGSGDTPMDQLFATLDPITRKVYAGEGKSYVLTDTVGFISRLPHEFIKAFGSTLEEARTADLLLHIVDASDPMMDEHIDVVRSVIDSLGAKDTPVITVFNKIDKAEIPIGDMPFSAQSVRISAKTNENVDKLKELIAKVLYKK